MSFFRNGGFIMIDTTSFLFFARRMMITDKQPNLIWGFKFGYKNMQFLILIKEYHVQQNCSQAYLKR